MYTQNFYNIANGSRALKGFTTVSYPQVVKDFVVKDYSGAERYASTSLNTALISYPNLFEYIPTSGSPSTATSGLPSTGIANMFVHLGNGNKEPSLDDYKLSGDYLTFVEVGSATETVTCDKANGKNIVTVSFVIQNTGSETIEVKEVGLFLPFAWKSSGSHGYMCLVERTVLETPITLEATQTGSIQLQFEYNYITP